MHEIHSRWREYPEIGFEHQRIFTVNKRIVELADVSGAMLSDYIEIGRDKIDTQLDIIERLRKFRNEPKHILIGRLALSECEDTALTFEGIGIKDDANIQLEHLLKNYQIYWHMVDSALYTPVVERQIYSDYPGLQGTWLGLQKP